MKTKQTVLALKVFAFYEVNVNSSVVFKHFGDLKDLIILKILKERLVMSFRLGSFILKLYKAFPNSTVQIAMIRKAMLKFQSKFQFKISVQLYKKVEKVETCDGNGQKFWKVPPSFQPSHFGYYFVSA